jgi:hypothetical protein
MYSTNIGPEWNMRSLPYPVEVNHHLSKLRYLELKRVDINPRNFISLIVDHSRGLREVYLNEVYLKVCSSVEMANTPLWIGYADFKRPKECIWVAEALREAHKLGLLKLDILRVTSIGYDDFDPIVDPVHSNYDLSDPTGKNRSYDQRFVEAVLGFADVLTPKESTAQTALSGPQTEALGDASNTCIQPPLLGLSEAHEYDADTFQRSHNTTSHYKRCIDGYFMNHNEQALQELNRIIQVADQGMSMLSEEIDRGHLFHVDLVNGELANP